MNVSKNDFFGSRSGGTIYSTNIYINPIAKFTDDNTPYEYTLYEFSEFVTIQGHEFVVLLIQPITRKIWPKISRYSM